MSTPSVRSLIACHGIDVVLSRQFDTDRFAVLVCRFPDYAACYVHPAAGSLSAVNYRDGMTDALLRGPVMRRVLDEVLDWTSRAEAVRRFEGLSGQRLGPLAVETVEASHALSVAVG